MPREYPLSTLLSLYDLEELMEIPDPFSRIISEEDIPIKYKAIRDSDWLIADYLWNNDTKEILSVSGREKCIADAAQKFNTYKNKILRVMSRFWQRGMHKNALLPDYDKCGMKGLSKRISEKKRGRPLKMPAEKDLSPGINIDEDLKEKIRTSIDLFYRDRKRRSLKETYYLMLEKFFSDRYLVNGKEIIKVWPAGRIPSYAQFFYWYRKETSFEKDFIPRYGNNAFNLMYRELTGNTSSRVFGPGSCYQIDATVADVYLVSILNRNKIIGRPVVYAVIDVYSRLFTGIYVGLEGPSWIGAMMALDNVVSDKVEFCKQYGIEITHEDWPCDCLPEAILADRGEFEGYNVEGLVNNLNIRIENTPPYRGDLKPVVERQFRTINEKIKHSAPGAVQKQFRERGGRDYRYDAALNLKEFTAIIIHLVLNHNKSIIPNYPREQALIMDDVPPKPLELWKWGLKNRACGLVRRDRDIVRLNLLPKGKATITRQGIRFRRLFYGCDLAFDEKWFVNPKHRSLEIAFDPRNIDNIYILSSNGPGYEKCYLLDKSSTYKGLSMEEVIFWQECEDERQRSDINTSNHDNVTLEANIQGIIKKAANETQKASRNPDKLENIRDNRSLEKELNHANEAFELGDDTKNRNDNILPEKSPEESRVQKSVELAKRVRGEKLGF